MSPAAPAAPGAGRAAAPGRAGGNRPADVVVVGGGLAGATAALDLAGAGARVTLLERRQHLGGLTWSFEHAGRQVDNGQHVFLRCCSAYRDLLERIGSAGDVHLQDRLRIDAVRPADAPRSALAGGRAGPPLTGVLARSGLPAPFHLAASLLRYRLLPPLSRLRTLPAVAAMSRLDLTDPALDRVSFADWLTRHGQDGAARAAVWDLITVATVNLPSSEASLAMAAMVFQTGLLRDAGAADLGWSTVPLGVLHGRRLAEALARAGVEVRFGRRVTAVERTRPGPAWTVTVDTAGGAREQVGAEGVVLALPHGETTRLLPAGSLPDQHRLAELRYSAIVNVHLTFDRRVCEWPVLAAVDSPLHWIFDRTASSGYRGPGQYLALTVSAADHLLGRRPDELIAMALAALRRLLPAAGSAEVLDALVTKERTATFAAVPGSGALRPPATTAHPGLVLAGAWTDTGWPATMEGAVRSGHAAAAAVSGGETSSRAPRPTEVVA